MGASIKLNGWGGWSQNPSQRDHAAHLTLQSWFACKRRHSATEDNKSATTRISLHIDVRLLFTSFTDRLALKASKRNCQPVSQNNPTCHKSHTRQQTQRVQRVKQVQQRNDSNMLNQSIEDTRAKPVKQAKRARPAKRLMSQTGHCLKQPT